MKTKPIVLLLLMLPFTFVYAQPKAARLIVRGDDMGYMHSGNDAMIKCYTEGIERSTEVIAVSPWFPEAVKLLARNQGLDVGVHLTLTSEWDNLKWRPLTSSKSLTDTNGYFYPIVFQNQYYPGQSLTENHWNLAEIETEYRAQIELALKNIPRISHVSTHMGCSDLSPEVKAMTKKLAMEYHINIEPSYFQVNYVGYDGNSKTSEEKIQSFIKMLNKLEPGKTYLFVDHPGYDNDEFSAVYLKGYENVGIDRQGVTDVFTSKKVRKTIRDKKIVLISYKDLVDQKK